MASEEDQEAEIRKKDFQGKNKVEDVSKNKNLLLFSIDSNFKIEFEKKSLKAETNISESVYADLPQGAITASFSLLFKNE